MARLLQPRAPPSRLPQYGKEAHREDRRVPTECTERRLRVQVKPPIPVAAPTASTPTTTYTMPLVTYPNRAIRSTQGLASWAASSARCSASCLVFSLRAFGKPKYSLSVHITFQEG